MQRIRRTRPNGVRSHKPVHREPGPHAPGSNGVTDAAGVALLAPAFAQALPSLVGLPTEYSHEFRAELVYDLCAALVREGLGTCESWKKCGESVLVFAKHAIMGAIGEHRWNLLQRNVEYHLEISDVADREGFDEVMGDGQLAITVVCGGSGYLKIGPAIEALEAEAPGLGAAFYWTLTYALYRLMRVYNHDDALQYEERMQEYAEQDEEENKGQYEFPEIEKALPDCIRSSLQRDNHDRWISAPVGFFANTVTADMVRGSNVCGSSNSSPGFVFAHRAISSKRVTTIARPYRPCWWPSKNETPLRLALMKRANTCSRGLRSPP